jgi:hypothetical protein
VTNEESGYLRRIEEKLDKVNETVGCVDKKVAVLSFQFGYVTTEVKRLELRQDSWGKRAWGFVIALLITLVAAVADWFHR